MQTFDFFVALSYLTDVLQTDFHDLCFICEEFATQFVAQQIHNKPEWCLDLKQRQTTKRQNFAD